MRVYTVCHSQEFCEAYQNLDKNRDNNSQLQLRRFFQSKSIVIFLISPQKHMLWVLIRSGLAFFLFLHENICCGTH